MAQNQRVLDRLAENENSPKEVEQITVLCYNEKGGYDMKTEWICTWSLIPGSERYVEKYSSEREAKTAMAQRISEYFDLKPYLDRMRKEKDPAYKEAADYLEKFLSCLMFSECAEETLPGLDGRAECFGAEEELSWSYDYKYFPYLSARESCIDEDPGLFVGVCLQRLPKTNAPQARGINIHIVERKNYGTSAYPLMVLDALRKEPKTQAQIVRTISEVWDTKIERKSVGRHLQLLQDLGFPVQHGLDGYYIDGENQAPKIGNKYSPSAYPLLILQVLDRTPQTNAAIIRAVQNKYSTKIDRKAVGRHMELLIALGYRIQECADGYYISK